jgi:3-methyladenine DNA glycosylase AlkD
MNGPRFGARQQRLNRARFSCRFDAEDKLVPKAPASSPQHPPAGRLEEALAALEALAETRVRDGMGRYGIVTADRVLGVSIANVQIVARKFGRDAALAAALWDSKVYEARLLVAYLGDPAALTREQMDRWTREIDNWGVCDTLCFKLFDQSAHAWEMVDRWADDPAEFVKRTAFALLACLALHDRRSGDAPFLERLPLIERGATDDRNFVKKGVSWALRAIGDKKSPALRAAARELADRLAAATDRTAKWVGRDAQKAFAKADKAA